jgi:hypothetical protein
MSRLPAIRVLVATVAVAAAALTTLELTTTSTQAQSPLSGSGGSRAERRVPLPQGRTAGVAPAVWADALASRGRLPVHERMMVVSPVGDVLGVVDGERDRVVLPPDLTYDLNHTTFRATLVHNHPDSVSLSGSDLFQLAKVGVERVIALGHDGSVYEATAASEYRAGDPIEYQYPILLRRVLDRLDREAQLSGSNLRALYPHTAHIMAVILDRVGVVHYSARPSLDVWNLFQRYRPVIQRIVNAEASRLEQDLGIVAD